MSFFWYFEDDDGGTVEIDKDTKYTKKQRNLEFFRLVNFVDSVIADQNLSLEKMWENQKTYRSEWIKL